MKRHSIARRLIVMVLLVELLSAACVTGLALIYERHAHFRAFEIMLRGRADSVIGAVQDAEDKDDNVMLDTADFQVPAEDVYEVRDEKNRLLGRSPNWFGADPALFESHQDGVVKLRIHGRHYRALVIHGMRIVDPGDKGGGIPRHIVVIYGSPTERVWHAILGAVQFYAIASLALMAFTGIAMTWLLHRGLAPLRTLASEAAKVSVNSWHFDPPEEARTSVELAPLTLAMENALARLEQSFSDQRRFTGDAAHELKTAVAVVKSSLQLLSMKPRSVDQYRAGLEKCQADCARMEEIVGKMLTLARFETPDSRTTVTTAGTELGGVIRQVEHQFRSMAEVRGVSVALDAPLPLFVVLQPEGAALLISNLLLNALQHSPKGTEIKISTQPRQDCVELTIQDQGEGIDADTLPHVFERFYRGDPSRNRNTGGTGLGLSICKAIVDAAGGEIRIESSPGTGTTAIVRLPVLQNDILCPEEFVTSAIFPSA